ncbi:MAG TPA: hypothetical protein VKI45_00870 [Allosphingosinicella sp.]|nr:hypothetical protein [Allosphingosinicella sp.]
MVRTADAIKAPKWGVVVTLLLAGLLTGAGATALFYYPHSGPAPSGHRLIDPDDIVHMQTVKNPRAPTHVKFVEMTVTSVPGTGHGPNPISVTYTRIADKDLAPGEAISPIIDDFAKNTFTPAWHQPTFHSSQANSNHPATALSLRENQATYIVFKLNCANCRFVRNNVPFRTQGHKDKYHVNPRVVWLSGGAPTSGDKPDANANAVIGYFIAYNDVDSQDNPGEFRSGFNLYLELTDPSGDVPISIDPDVGYPGGHS